MKTINVMLKKCKTLSKQITRASSSRSIGSKSSRHDDHHQHHNNQKTRGIIWNTKVISAVYVEEDNGNGNGSKDEQQVFVGSARKRYVISSKYLTHPLINALIEKSKQNNDDDVEDVSVINCEVVLFDHLLWMIETSDLNVTSDCLDELADLYSF
ncbi:auxin-responsive protein SAUR76 [Rutidosis leptorrhynchoides]|uniref:auxin-responsive protein SAUR76 n=1 Tax=Rutidosis leptorrhynchoides TaxID=125765 RepID=UPI003A98F848